MSFRPLLGPGRDVMAGGRVVRYEFPGMEVVVPRPVFRPVKPPWTPRPLDARMLDAALRSGQRRAMDEAARQAEQAAARERAAREARERVRAEQQAEVLREQARIAMTRAELQREEENQRRQQDLQREQQRALDRMRQRQQQRAGFGTMVGGFLAGLVPPAHRAPFLRRPPEFLGAQGGELVVRQADRTAWEVNWAMENFSFWVNQAAQVISGAIGIAGEAAAVGAVLRPAANRIANLVGQSAVNLSRSVGRAAVSSAPQSIDQVLLGCRDEAFRIASRLVAQDVVSGQTMRPQRFGELVDALFKSLVQHSRSTGMLPGTIRTGPPPLGISGRVLPRGGAIDVWDSTTGIGWDVTKATVRDVAAHERYLGRVMPDGTTIRDVRPLVYPRR